MSGRGGGTGGDRPPVPGPGSAGLLRSRGAPGAALRAEEGGERRRRGVCNGAARPALPAELARWPRADNRLGVGVREGD